MLFNMAFPTIAMAQMSNETVASAQSSTPPFEAQLIVSGYKEAFFLRVDNQKRVSISQQKMYFIPILLTATKACSMPLQPQKLTNTLLSFLRFNLSGIALPVRLKDMRANFSLVGKSQIDGRPCRVMAFRDFLTASGQSMAGQICVTGTGIILAFMRQGETKPLFH